MKRISIIWSISVMLLASCGTSPEQTTVQEVKPLPLAPPVEVVEKTVEKPLPSHGLTGSGKVKAANFIDLYFRLQEQIAHIYVRNGAKVSKGQKLADLEMFTLNDNLRQAEISLEQAHLELQDILIGQGYDPDKLDVVPAEMMKLAKVKSGYEQAELQKVKALREIENATLVAPFDGVIANLTAKPHHMVGGSEPFCRIIQNYNMEVEFYVLESELHLVKMGQKVEIIPQASTVSVQTGEIFEMNPMVDEKGQVQIKARVKGNVGLMEGMNVTVQIQP